MTLGFCCFLLLLGVGGCGEDASDLAPDKPGVSTSFKGVTEP